MWIRTETIIPMSQINNKFSRVYDILEKYGSAIVMKNNMPVYIIYEPDFFEQKTLESMADISIRDASQNFSKVTMQVYNNALVVIRKRDIPVAVIADYNYAEHSNYLNKIQYIKGEYKDDSNAQHATNFR